MHTLGVVSSVSVAALLASGMTATVAAAVRRSSATVEWHKSVSGPVFVVRNRRWQSRLLRAVGILGALCGALLLAGGLLDDDPQTRGMTVAGAVMVLGAAGFVWLAHAMTRMHLEVSARAVWVVPMCGRPRNVELSEITTLEPLVGQNYGGIVARAGTRRVFSCSKLMIGYPELIEHLGVHRPDLAVPTESSPI